MKFAVVILAYAAAVTANIVPVKDPIGKPGLNWAALQGSITDIGTIITTSFSYMKKCISDAGSEFFGMEMYLNQLEHEMEGMLEHIQWHIVNQNLTHDHALVQLLSLRARGNDLENYITSNLYAFSGETSQVLVQTMAYTNYELMLRNYGFLSMVPATC